MKKTLFVLGFFTALSLSLFKLTNAFANSLILEVPDNPEPTTEVLAYQCNTDAPQERIEVTYIDAQNVSLADFTWRNDRVIAANVMTEKGTKYAGAHYILWKTLHDITLYDLINDPEEKRPILCKEESTLLF
ncbi:MliC family protein [Bartonella sp. B30(2025)]